MSDDIKEKLEEQHRAIDEAVRQTEVILASGIENSFRDLKLQVSALHKLVSINFNHEESIGKLEEVLEEFPRLTNLFDRFNKEHGELINELERLQNTAAELSSFTGSRIQSLREDFDTFKVKLESHESREFEAIQEAYTTDISQAD